MFRRAALSGLAWRTAASALCLLLLAACPDGYPTEDAPLIEPSRMTQAQLLAALNELGAEPHLGKRWRYALHANCELAVSVRNGETIHQRVVLEGATFDARSADQDLAVAGLHPSQRVRLDLPRCPTTMRVM